MAWTLRLKKLILPPSGPLLAGLAGVALLAAAPGRLGLGLVAASLGSLYLLSAPWFVARLLATLDRYPHFDFDGGEPEAEAIVILDGGRLVAPPERGGNAPSPRTLERMETGARLHRRTGAPILVTGYGRLMAESLERAFGLTARWVEDRSRTTWENAAFSAALLRQAGVGRIYLVTHAWHLPRAMAAFERMDLDVVAVPAGRTDRLPSERGLAGLVPSPGMVYSSYLVLHEWIGIVWYRIRYGMAAGPTTDRSQG